ncbi:EpsG family protein [Tenacibaculum sp. 47A_GOM-205m]|uniref:EpsG family protein n=1 Tax=Tenacibaculum sp. 47A_GOM-205m TaxID=1380384 RepID=UPI00048C07EF|nr:EpsG family protein [Tenacibaculum sp. 47A_GOM-205m]
MSIDFIPLEYYTPIFYYILMLVVLFTFLELLTKGFLNTKYGLLFVFAIVLYMGLRPISGFYFGDTLNYAQIFERYQNSVTITTSKDVSFHYFIMFCSTIMGVHTFFLICAFLYVYPLYLVSKKWFKQYWFYAFLLLVASFSFWAGGVNGIRNSMAGSLFLFGVSRDKRLFQMFWIFIAINFHKSMLLPTMGFILAQFYNKPKYIIVFWLLCIPLSLIGGGFWEVFFANLGFQDDRLSYLTQGNINNDNFAYTGFRWDFLLYSSFAVYAGWYFIVKRGFNDKVYNWLFITYLVANAFWILVIRANFSNRFAYLSWFMMALVIVYPLLKERIIKQQSIKLGWIILIYFAFTFFMNVILK